MNKILEKARAIEQEIIADRRCLHQMPEVGVYTPRTAAYIKERLTEMGIAHRDCGVHSQEDREKMVFAGYPDAPTSTGVVAVIGKGGPCILLRADMDGLPMEETTGLDFAAKGDTAHMCGHDAHAAMLLGAARILKEMEDELPGTVKLMFQPDEEGCAPDEICGNEAMINAGVLENPHVDAATAIHLMPFDYRLGEIATRPGTGFSSIDDIDIVVHGKGGHGSRPHQLVDPFNIACHIFFGAQNLIARELDPNDQAVITFGAINGGTAANIVPDDVHLLGTLRTIDEGTRAHLKERMEAMCRGIAEGFGGSVDVRFLRGVPSVYNDPDLTDELIGYVEDLTGRPVTILDKPISGSDDMSVISQAVPTTYFVMGTGSEDEGVRYPVHNSRVVFDESVFVEGAAMTATMALRWLEARARDDKENER